MTQDSYKTWNQYAFGGANPIMNIDPSGHSAFPFLPLLAVTDGAVLAGGSIHVSMNFLEYEESISDLVIPSVDAQADLPEQAKLSYSSRDIKRLAKMKQNKRVFRLGAGGFGTAYYLKNERGVVKLLHEEDAYAAPARVSRVLNEINGDGFAGVAQLADGKEVLMTKFVNGETVHAAEAYGFVADQGRILFDAGVPGNVLKEQNTNQFYLIDADNAVMSRENGRHLSDASEKFLTKRENNGINLSVEYCDYKDYGFIPSAYTS